MLQEVIIMGVVVRYGRGLNGTNQGMIKECIHVLMTDHHINRKAECQALALKGILIQKPIRLIDLFTREVESSSRWMASMVYGTRSINWFNQIIS